MAAASCAAALFACAGPRAPREELPGLRYHRPATPAANTERRCEVAVYGGTPAGVAAAVQAARMGRTAILVTFGDHVGGLTSGGLTATDAGDAATIGGLAREFYDRIGLLKDFAPSAAEETYRALLDEAGVEILPRRPLVDVESAAGALTALVLEGGVRVEAEVFVDATYEGDLLGAAGVSYRVGREPRAAFGESLAGQWQSVSWAGVYQFCGLPIDPFRVPGDPASGLLPGIDSEPAGAPGQGDHRVQAYNFRMQLTDAPERLPFPRPASYDPGRYELLARLLAHDGAVTWTLNYTTRPMTDGPVQLRRGDCNNAGSVSTDAVGASHRWPDGTYVPGSFDTLPPPRRGLPVPLPELYRLREGIFQDHVAYQAGLMHFLSSDARVPAALRERVLRFGLDPDQFPGSSCWPHALYVREGRRMVSDRVMTQADCEGTRVADDSVGLASYAMDSHFCQRVVVPGEQGPTVRNEGGFGHPCAGPYPVAYGALVPRRSECSNLLVPVCLSASHVAYGSIRMEPVFMILGQSAGAAASLAVEGGVAVQEVSYASLRGRLLLDGQRL